MITRTALEQLDKTDPLAPFRDRFHLPAGIIYLDGNSLGPLPRATPGRIAALIEREWGEGLIRSWNDAGWISLANRIASEIAHLIGAVQGSVAVADSTSVNLFKLLGAALHSRPDRHVIVSEQSTFPTDLYIAQGLTAFLGGRHDLRLVAPDEIPAAIDDDTAVVMLTHVNYRTGAMHDMTAITRAAHARGRDWCCGISSHSAGAVPVDLTAANADFAVGCGYKFLNGGPGAPGLPLRRAPPARRNSACRITGWLGHAAAVRVRADVSRRAAASRQAIVGTPPILSLAALEVGVEHRTRARRWPRSATKSCAQVEMFAELVEQACARRFRLRHPGRPSPARQPGLPRPSGRLRRSCRR